jgi:WD40 repeat protein
MPRLLIPIPQLAVLLAAAGACLSEPTSSAPQGKSDSQEAKETREQIRRLERLAKGPPADSAAFWKTWRGFKLAHSGRPEYIEAAALLHQAPSPLDALDRRDIPAEERLPWMPPEVVAVLGEHRGLDNGAQGLSISEEGRLIAAGGQVWDSATMNGWALLTPGPWERYSTAAFSPKGRLLAAAYSGGITLWDLSGKTPVRKADLEGLTKGVKSLAWSADGKTLVSLGRARARDRQKALVVWNLEGDRPQRRRTIALNWGDGGSLALSPDSRWLAIDGMQFGSTCLWDLSRSADRSPIELQHVAAPRFSPDSRVLLANDESGQKARLWKLTDSGPRDALDLPIRHFALLTFSPDGKYLAEGGWDPESTPASDDEWRITMGQHRLLRVWDAEAARRGELRPVGKPILLPFVIQELVFFPDSKRLVLRPLNRPMVLWDVERGSPCLEFSGHGGTMRARFAPDGRSLASGSYDGAVYWWDLMAKPARELEALRGHFHDIRDLQFAPQGGYLVCLGNDRRDQRIEFRLWSLAGDRMKQLAVESPFTNDLTRMAFSPDGNAFAATGLEDPLPAKPGDRAPPRRAKVRLWELRDETLTERATLSPRDCETDVYPGGWCGNFTADSRAFLFSLSGTLRSWTVSEKGGVDKTVLAAQRKRGGSIDCLTVSPQGLHWATAEDIEDRDQGITTLLRIWEVKGDAVREQWTSKVGPGIRSLRFSPDGQTLAVLEKNAPRLTLWDAASGRKVREIPLQWGLHDFDWAPDGRHIATAGNGPIYIYRLAERGQALAK